MFFPVCTNIFNLVQVAFMLQECQNSIKLANWLCNHIKLNFFFFKIKKITQLSCCDLSCRQLTKTKNKKELKQYISQRTKWLATKNFREESFKNKLHAKKHKETISKESQEHSEILIISHSFYTVLIKLFRLQCLLQLFKII